MAPSATLYAACASNNIINSANGNQGVFEVVYNSDINSNNQVIASGAQTPYDCCVACQTTANCIFSDVLFGNCELVIGSMCSPSSGQNTGFCTLASVAAGAGFTLSNGPCGQIPDDEVIP